MVSDKNVPEECTTIFVGNLPYYITEDNLGDRFRGFGAIKNVRFARNWYSKAFKGFAYIDFEQ